MTATVGSFFRTPVTRSLRWAIPLAIVGYVILVALPLVGRSGGLSPRAAAGR